MNSYNCNKGCCSVDIATYVHKSRFLNSRRPKYNKKAGVFIYDPNTTRVLLVQSRGQLWGPPKGTIEKGESDIECAVREVKEETGLDIDPSNFLRAIRVGNRAMYFYMEMDAVSVEVQNEMEDNDANGITWIKVECLKECIYDGHIILNRHAKIAFNHFLSVAFPKSTFTKVTRK